MGLWLLGPDRDWGGCSWPFCQVLHLHYVRSPFAAAVCEGQLYWSDRKPWSVQQVDKTTGKNRTVVLKRRGQPHGLQVLIWESPEPCYVSSAGAPTLHDPAVF